MPRAFELQVSYNGRPDRLFTSVANGGGLSAQELSDHHQRHNSFPGASRIIIREMEGMVPEKLRQVLSNRRSLAKTLKPLTTPAAEISPEKYVPPGFDELAKLPPPAGTFAAVQAQRVVPDSLQPQPEAPSSSSGPVSGQGGSEGDSGSRPRPAK